MKFRQVIISILFLLSVSIAFSQEKIYIPYFKCQGCNIQSGNSASFLFSEYVNEIGKFEAVRAQERDSAFAVETYNGARESADLLSVKYFILGTMLKLEGTYYIKVSLYATSSGLKIWSASRNFNEAQDIPIVLKELASKIDYTEKKSRPGDIYLISQADGKKVNRIRSNKSLGFVTGAMIPLSEKKVNHINPGFGGLLSFDLRSFILETSAEIYFAKDSLYDGYSYDDVNNRYYNLNINTIYPLSTTNSAPFLCLGTGFSYRESEVKYYPVWPGQPESDKKYDQGITFNGGGGYMFKRNSDATLFVYARGYVYMPNMDTYIYGVMLNFAVHIEGW